MYTHQATVSLPDKRFSIFQRIALVVGALAIALTALAVPAYNAEAALIDRVNEAAREAGAPVIAERTAAFMAGVFTGHYTNYQQLVGAIIWHKDNGTLPSFSAKAAVTTVCTTGDITSLAYDSSAKAGSLVVRGDIVGADGSLSPQSRTLNIADNQHAVLVERGVVIGSNVTTCWIDSNPKTLYGHVTKS